MHVNSPYGIVLAHNGNLTNAETLQADLFREDQRHLNTDSDSEVLLNVFAHELQIQSAHNPQPDHVFDAVRGLHHRCRGAYAAVAMIIGVGIAGFYGGGECLVALLAQPGSKLPCVVLFGKARDLDRPGRRLLRWR